MDSELPTSISVSVLESDDINKLIDYEHIDRFKSRGLNSEHPVIRGTARTLIYISKAGKYRINILTQFQMLCLNMNKFATVTGRQYKPYEYYGVQDADGVIVAMGSYAIL